MLSVLTKVTLTHCVEILNRHPMLRANIETSNDGSLNWSLLSRESLSNVETYIPKIKVGIQLYFFRVFILTFIFILRFCDISSGC